jgi:hypothetical protein
VEVGVRGDPSRVAEPADSLDVVCEDVDAAAIDQRREAVEALKGSRRWVELQRGEATVGHLESARNIGIGV